MYYRNHITEDQFLILTTCQWEDVGDEVQRILKTSHFAFVDLCPLNFSQTHGNYQSLNWNRIREIKHLAKSWLLLRTGSLMLPYKAMAITFESFQFHIYKNFHLATGWAPIAGASQAINNKHSQLWLFNFTQPTLGSDFQFRTKLQQKFKIFRNDAVVCFPQRLEVASTCSAL